MQCCESGSGAFLTPGSGMGKVRIRLWDEQSGSYRISLSLETIFLGKILKFFDAVPGWKKFGSRIRDGKKSDLGSDINITDP